MTIAQKRFITKKWWEEVLEPLKIKISLLGDRQKRLALFEIFVLIYPFINPLLGPVLFISVLKIISLFGLFISDVRKKVSFWVVFLVICCLSQLYFVFSIDNHIWLFIYLIMSIISFKINRQEAALETNLKLLLGIIFIAAFLQKAFNGEFFNGAFYEFQLAGADWRFHNFAVLFGGYDVEMVKLNNYIAKNFALSQFVPMGFQDQMVITPAIRAWAIFFSYYSLAIDLAIGILFLLSVKFPKYELFAHISLLIFILSTYLFVSVPGFATLLVFMGLVLNKQTKYDYLYLLSLIVVLIGDANPVLLIRNMFT